jgi:hypothetical protein
VNYTAHDEIVGDLPVPGSPKTIVLPSTDGRPRTDFSQGDPESPDSSHVVTGVANNLGPTLTPWRMGQQVTIPASWGAPPAALKSATSVAS